MTQDIRDVLKLALAALKDGDWYINQLEMIVYCVDNDEIHFNRAKVQTAIKVAEEALAQTEQEPVAWQFFQGGKWHNGMEFHNHRKHTIAAGTPVRDLYTSSPQRKPLTDEAIAQIAAQGHQRWFEFARAIEAAHGIKENT